MIVKLGYALSIKTKYLQPRGRTFQFAMRIPTELVPHYGKKHIRQSLKTDDLSVAIRKVEKLARVYKAEFAALSDNKELTPRETIDAAERMAEKFMTLEHFVDKVADPKRQAYSGDCWDTYVEAPVEEFLNPVEQEVLKRLQKPDEQRLSGTFSYYEKHHPKANDERFMARALRDWNKLIAVVGNITLDEFNRTHTRHYISTRLADGMSTGTVACVDIKVTAIRGRSGVLKVWVPLTQ
ncbi:MAG: hypothetical protein COB25_008500 [Oceanospirillales bacterium]|nr:hypothetical protein [Oceanospirillales bacterium]